MLYHEDGSKVIGPRKDLNIRKDRISNKHAYLGNPKIKRANVNIKMSDDELSEYVKCADDPIYFIRSYFKIVNVDGGLVYFDMYDYQEDAVLQMHNNRFTILLQSRQSGKCQVVDSIIKIRNKKNPKEIFEIKIGDFHNGFKTTEAFNKEIII